MDNDPPLWFWLLVYAVIGALVLYVTVRLAVSHAIRSTTLWRHDGRFARQLAERRRARAEESREG